jgi:hypothetical protein
MDRQVRDRVALAADRWARHRAVYAAVAPALAGQSGGPDA